MRLRRVLATLATLACLWSATSACSPGRGGIRRRGARKLTPLVYKQHVPNFSERSLAAAGGPEGAVSRTSPGFERKLVPNYNPDIVFKDEEGTGADRLMTPRCKEKLNTLSISVLNQWPGVALRVTEAWDEDGHHADQSLHYEGRAVDVTTSDRDRKKYGMLARLAVEAGFDWVYYESRSHVHASCKSEATHPSKNGGCFPASSVVLTEDGTRKFLSELRVGDRVLAATADGGLVFSPVLLFLDRKPDEDALFYTLHTDSGHSVTATPMHLVYAANVANEVEVDEAEAAFEATFARDVNEGDLVLVQDGAGPLRPARVVRVEARARRGVYAPLTAEGNVVVDNVLASCYAVIESQCVAHAAFAPVRAIGAVRDFLGMSSSPAKEEASSGVHWYADALYSVARRWLHDQDEA